MELRHAVSIALDVIAKGERPTNQEEFVENVLKRLAETTKSGDFDAGTKAVDDALAELDRREEEQRQTSRSCWKQAWSRTCCAAIPLP